MHTAVEHLAKAAEALQTSPNGGILFQDGNLETFFGEYGSYKQSTESASYNDY